MTIKSAHTVKENPHWSREFNRKGEAKYKRIRCGVYVQTNDGRGRGIVSARTGSEIWVTFPSRTSMPGETYTYDVSDVTLCDNIPPLSGIGEAEGSYERYAWTMIYDAAMSRNQSYEARWQMWIVAEYEALVPGKRKDRDIGGEWGTFKYRRYVGKNKRGEPFDFEVCVTRPFIPDGDRILFALGVNDYITRMNGHGRIYTQKITDEDVNYGLAKYAAPKTEEEGD